MLWIRDILVRIRAANLYLWLTDPDPAILSVTSKTAKICQSVFAYYFLKPRLQNFSKMESHKEDDRRIGSRFWEAQNIRILRIRIHNTDRGRVLYWIVLSKLLLLFPVICLCGNSTRGTPTKRQVSKRQVSKRPGSKRLERQVYKTPGLQNVRFTKCQVYKLSGLQNVWLQKNIHIPYILYLWLFDIRRFCVSHVCRQSDGCVLFSILEGFFAICHHNK